MANNPKIRFTKHALDKFEFLRNYGFRIDKGQVMDVVLNPDRLDEK